MKNDEMILPESDKELTNKTPEIIFPDSDKSATYRTNIEGWVDSNGHFFGNDEITARNSGATHYKCTECGTPTEKYWTICGPCKDVKELKKYSEFPKTEWNRKDPLYSHYFGDYYFPTGEPEVIEDIIDFFNLDYDDPISLAEARFVICNPIYLSPIDDENHWADDLPEDFGLPSKIQEAVTNLNRLISKEPPASWIPSEIRPLIKDNEFVMKGK